MGKYLNVGNAGFKAMTKGMYVDKTGLISYINNTLGTTEKLTCVSRPRRFGKSFAAKMLCAYYDKSCDSRELFAGYEIEKDPSFLVHLNQYDVLYLDITLFIANADHIKNVVSDLKTQVVHEIHSVYPETKNERTLFDSIFKAAELIDRKFIVIIDEWDALFREAKDDLVLQKEYIHLLRSLFKSSLTDTMIEAAYLTGILPIKKYGTQSALTDFREFTMIQPEPLERYAGFTEEEVYHLCSHSAFDFAEIQKWYDGYLLGSLHIYNPKSVADSLMRRKIRNYWTQTETYESLKAYIEMDIDGLNEAVVQMLGGAHIKIDTGTFQNDITSIKRKDDILTLLVHLGYLAYNADEKCVFIPNEEVHQEFVRTVSAGKHTEIAKLIQNSDYLLEQTLNMNEKEVAASIEKAHSAGTAPTFYNNKQALRSVIRFSYISCIDEFTKIEELPSGKGYADLVYLPKMNSSKPILLIELKWNKSEDGAINQIKNNNYPQILQGTGRDLLLVGINYDAKTKKHTCKIEKFNLN